MSDFMTALVDLLPEHNSLKKINNGLFTVLDKSVGEWFDNHNIQAFYDALFLNTATGKYLDLHGKDFGVIRKSGESDDSFNARVAELKALIASINKVDETYYVYLDTNTTTNERYDSNDYASINTDSDAYETITADFKDKKLDYLRK